MFNQPLFSAADDAAYIFPGSRDFATLGSFDKNGLLIRGQKVSYRIEGCDVRGLLKLKFSEPLEPKVFYHYLPAKKDDFGDQPHIVDEVAEEYIEVRHINDYEGDGTWATKDIPKDTMVMQYGGFLLSNHSNLEEKYDSGHAYTQTIGGCEGVKIDIPKGFEDASKYNGTLAHKTQHDFNPNGEMRRVDTARYGHIVGFFTIKEVKKGEQFLSNYYGAIPQDNPEAYSIPKW